MPRDPFRIFLSGSTADFGDTRLSLRQALARGGCHVIHQADFPQTQADTVLKLAQLIEPCGVLIHLIGRKPGSIADKAAADEYLAFADKDGAFLKSMPGLRKGLGDLSGITYTQWEVLIALHLGITVFVYGDATHSDPAHPQRAHLDRLIAARRYSDTFEDELDLHKKVQADLMYHYRQVLPPAQVPKFDAPQNLPGGYIGRLFLGRDDFLERLRQSLLNQTHHATAITQAPAHQSSPSGNPQLPSDNPKPSGASQTAEGSPKGTGGGPDQSAIRNPQFQNVATGISGLGGIGKTHAAVEYAHRHRGDYTALLFVSGETPERLNSGLASLCGVLHLDAEGALPPDEPSRVAAAVHWLATHRDWLLIVDNIDDEKAAAALTALLGDLTAGHVLITSRLREWADNVEALDIEVLSPPAATELLLRLTKDKRRPAADDAAQARALADLLEGLPLALHQAAGYINQKRLTLAAYLAIYEKEASELLAWFKPHLIHYAGPEEVGPRPVWITWKASFDKLEPDTRRWLRVFAHFAPEPIPEFLLESLPDADADTQARHRAAFEAIVQAETYSLLTRDREQPRFKLHRLVQHIIRLTSTQAENATALEEAIQLIIDCEPGDALDVRSWPRWNPLQAHAVAICDHAPDEPPSKSLIWLLNSLGLLFRTKALYAEAEPLMRRALQIGEACFEADHPYVATYLNNLATLLKDTARFAEAEPLYSRALKIDESNFGPDHPDVATGVNNIAQLLKATNRHADAEPLMRRVVGILANKGGEPHPNYAAALSNLASLFHATNRTAEAEPLMRQALQIDKASFGPDHPNVARHLCNLAKLLQDKNRLAEAEPLMRRALEIRETSLGEEHLDSRLVRRNYEGLLKEIQRQKTGGHQTEDLKSSGWRGFVGRVLRWFVKGS